MYSFYNKNFVLPPGRTAKILLIVKLTTLLLITAILQVSASTFAQKVTLSVKNAPLRKVFLDIRQQTGYDFVFTTTSLKGANDVTISVKNAELNEVLKKIFDGQPLTYAIEDKSVIITQNIKALQHLAVPQDALVHGVVYNDKDEPLPGASIRLPGFRQSASTDERGMYVITDAPANASLVASFVGYKSDTILINGQNEINFHLKPLVTAMKEVTVSTGYQKLNKERVTGSFGKPDMEVYTERVGTNDLVSRLDGLVAGVTVLSGPRGSGTTQQSIIRGKSSVKLQSDPLYVVNGVQIQDLSTVNPDDVADITVLKDAAASAIWGARAANGVIVITTKSGNTRQKVKINYSGNVSFQGKPNFDYLHYMNSAQFVQAAKEIFNPTVFPWASLSTDKFIAPHELILYNQYRGLTSGAQANASLDSLSGIDNREQIEDLWYRNALVTNHTVSASGGNNVYSFYSSLSYSDNQSNKPGSVNNTYRINLNQTFAPTNGIKISLYTTLNNNVSNSKNMIGIAGDFLPYQLFRDANGNNINLNYLQGYTAATRADYQARSHVNLDYSPLDEINSTYSKNNFTTINTTANVAVKIWKGLSFDGTYGYQKSPGTTANYADISAYSQRRQLLNFTVAPTTSSTPVYYLPTTGGQYVAGTNDAHNWTVRNQLVFNTGLRGDKDRLNIQVGQESQEQFSKINTSTVMGYNDLLQTYSLLNYATLANGVFGTVGSGRSVFTDPPFTTLQTLSRFTSNFGLLNYAFNKKYLLDASIRQDHSNVFSSDKSTQKKPSYSIGGKWLLKQEGFMQNITWLDDLGLRATYGITGNSPYLGAGSTFDILSAQTDAVNGSSLALGTPANNKLSWETTHTMNFGIDFAVFHSRLSGSIDLYHKSTTDLIGTANLNPLTGFASATGNIGDVKNSGVELNLRSQNLHLKDFSWSTNFVFSYNNNKLASYSNPTQDLLTATGRISSTYVAGYKLLPLFAYRYAGLDNMGDPQIKLANGTITKDPDVATANDLVYMGTQLPVFNGGLTNTFRYKGLSLAVNMVYSLGAVMRRDVNNFYSGRLTGSPGSYTNTNINPDFENRWKNPGDEGTTDIPSYVANIGISSSRRNTLYYTKADINVVSASYAKIRDMTLAYSFQPSVLKRIGVENVNLFVQTGNYMVWKKNKYDIDPEYQGYSEGTRGLPAYSHNYSLGLNVTF